MHRYSSFVKPSRFFKEYNSTHVLPNKPCETSFLVLGLCKIICRENVWQVYKFTMEHFYIYLFNLWGRVTHLCISKLTIIGSDNGTNFSPNQNLNKNLYIFIQENAFEHVVWKVTAILSQSQCVKKDVLDYIHDYRCSFQSLRISQLIWVLWAIKSLWDFCLR